MRQAVHTVLRARTNAVKTLPLSARGKGPSISCNPLALTSRRGGARNLATESESKRDKIILKGLVFHGYHGVYKFERDRGQKFILDVELVTDLRLAAESGHLKKTTDYGAVYRDIKDIVEGKRSELLETLAHNIIKRVLQRYAGVQEVCVLVKKPQVAVSGVVEYLGIEIRRSRADLEESR